MDRIAKARNLFSQKNREALSRSYQTKIEVLPSIASKLKTDVRCLFLTPPYQHVDLAKYVGMVFGNKYIFDQPSGIMYIDGEYDQRYFTLAIDYYVENFVRCKKCQSMWTDIVMPRA